MLRFKFVGVMVLALVLAGCETLDIASYIPEMPQRGAPDQQGMGESVTSPNASRPTRAGPGQVEPEYIPSTDELMGADVIALEGYLGQPSLRRAEQSSEVWQYATDTCVLFVFFYPNAVGEARVSYITSSSIHQGEPSPGDQQCVEAVTRAVVNEAVAS